RPASVVAVAGDGDTSGALAYASTGSKVLSKALGVFITFNIVCLAWVFFRSETLEAAIIYLKGLTDWSGPVELATFFLFALVTASLAAHFLSEDLVERVSAYLEKFGTIVIGTILGVGVLVIWAIAPEGTVPFIYFQF
ncbi:MAG: hypothetical protein WD688_08380, partial [Candidatus Binatia bacterium]